MGTASGDERGSRQGVLHDDHSRTIRPRGMEAKGNGGSLASAAPARVRECPAEPCRVVQFRIRGRTGCMNGGGAHRTGHRTGIRKRCPWPIRGAAIGQAILRLGHDPSSRPTCVPGRPGSVSSGIARFGRCNFRPHRGYRDPGAIARARRQGPMPNEGDDRMDRREDDMETDGQDEPEREVRT